MTAKTSDNKTTILDPAPVSRDTVRRLIVAARDPLTELLGGLDGALAGLDGVIAAEVEMQRLTADKVVLAREVEALRQTIHVETIDHKDEQDAWAQRRAAEVKDHADKLEAHRVKVIGDLERRQALIEGNIAGAEAASRQRLDGVSQRIEQLQSQVAELSAQRAEMETAVAELRVVKGTLQEEINEFQQHVNRIATQHPPQPPSQPTGPKAAKH